MIEYYDKEELELQISNYLSGNSTDEEKKRCLPFWLPMKQLPGLSGKCLPYGHFLPYRRLQK